MFQLQKQNLGARVRETTVPRAVAARSIPAVHALPVRARVLLFVLKRWDVRAARPPPTKQYLLVIAWWMAGGRVARDLPATHQTILANHCLVEGGAVRKHRINNKSIGLRGET